jgi:hypothetical protein
MIGGTVTKAKRYETVILTESIGNISAGEIGAVVEVYTKPYEAYDIEIVNDKGETRGLLEGVLPEQITSVTAAKPTFVAINLIADGEQVKILFSDGSQVTVTAEELHPRAV